MAKVKGTVEIDISRCKGCRECVEACPTDVLAMSAKVNGMGYNYAYMNNADKCIGCASCGMVCPDSCLTVYKIKEDGNQS